MAYIATVSDDEATGSLAKQYEAARGRAGSVASIIRLHSLDPQSLRASMQLYMATTVRPDSPLGRMEREFIATVVSRANDCFY
jgi:alkylhydroperoxidase family enzyme